MSNVEYRNAIKELNHQTDLILQALQLHNKTFDLLIARIEALEEDITFLRNDIDQDQVAIQEMIKRLEALELKTMDFADPFCYDCKQPLTKYNLPNFCNEFCKKAFDIKMEAFDKDDE